MWTYGYFSASEFACRCGCGAGMDLMDIDRDLLIKLNAIREVYGPIACNSAARCPEHNAKVSKTKNSAHITIPGTLQCRAFDIRCTNSIDRGRLNELVYQHFSRVGLHKAFIHVDVAAGPEYTPIATWFY